ncbi:hypothetical protein DACRYDRAFT_92605 [Dacryopinax primogenitus]|uniref:Actin-crosslinking protein n=1 Tax=Dacryopinax primogenitus (strain DJM 731) TaxID=1858805 RepID=M5G4J1_DACPD|nr:uncharacterized protein DACRYDRAFT_92605 [Dacryopinax primogenitus]EJU05171.1 hypothetical protein DACRYDRAFT_92605 [Dacryopinax primogenitus]
MSTPVRRTKLSFKGDKPLKKKKAHQKEGNARNGEEGDPQDWVFPDVSEQILGPTFVLSPSSSSPYCLAYDSTRARLQLSQLSDDAPPDRPTEVAQVWVATHVAGTASVNLRTPDGRFLSCDKFGVVGADSEARGPQEEWVAERVSPEGEVKLEEGEDKPANSLGKEMYFGFKSVHGGWLGLDELAGGKVGVRGDAEKPEPWIVRVQREWKVKAGEEERKRNDVENPGKRKIDEVETNHEYQAWGAGRSVVSQDDTRDLKKARKDGRLSEAMLDRRAKLKSDRFC